AAARLRPDRRAAARRRAIVHDHVDAGPAGRNGGAVTGLPDALPPEGVPVAQVLDEVRGLRAADRPTHGGRLFAYVYDPGLAGLDELAMSAYALAAHVNGLDPTAFPSLLAMENALVGAAAR